MNKNVRIQLATNLSRQQCFWLGCAILFLSALTTLVLIFTLDPSQRAVGLRVSFGSLIAMIAALPLWISARDRDVGIEQLEKERREFERVCNKAESDLRKQGETLDRRERVLADRFLQYESWMEYPIPMADELASEIDSGDLPSNNQVPADEERLPQSEENGASQPETRLEELDRVVVQVLEQKAELLFDKIKANEYGKSGSFDIDLLRSDLLEIVSEVARVYNPDSENPLLETSVENLLRAGSRTCLHLLVLMERLPINIAAQNLQSLHGYLRQALRAYKVYQAVQPYMPYVQYATYAGRLVLGSNPIGLGAQWALWKLGTKGATAATKQLVNRQALGFVRDSIRVVGFEVAGIYGGDFRHRDKQWIYGTELTELLSFLPLSRDLLVAAFSEIGQLTLRSEYDRVFLYRCIAAHRSADPSRFEVLENLAHADRDWIASNLERFATRFVGQREPVAMAKWEKELKKRLGIAVNLMKERKPITSQLSVQRIARASASMLIHERNIPFDRVADLVTRSIAGQQLPQSQIVDIVSDLKESTSGHFEIPELDSDSEWIDVLMNDLALMTATTLGSLSYSTISLDWCAEYYRVDERRIRKTIDNALVQTLGQRASAHASDLSLKTDEMIRVLQAVPEHEKIECVYTNAEVIGPNQSKDDSNERYLLVGTNGRILLLDEDLYAPPLWEADSKIKFEREKRLLQQSIIMEGGRWREAGQAQHQIRLKRTAAKNQDAYFDPVLQLLNRLAKNDSVIGDGNESE